MAVILGSSSLYQLRQNGNTKYRSVYVGEDHTWPDYIFEPVPNTFCHEQDEYTEKEYSFENQNPLEDLDNYLEIDPAGGTLSIEINSVEFSEWHFMPFKIRVPKEVTLTKVTQNGNEFSFINYPIKTAVSGLTQNYDGKIYIIDICRLTNLEIPYPPSDNLNIKLEFSVESNETNEARYREISLFDFRDENNWHNITPIIIAKYQQNTNSKYMTSGCWVKNTNYPLEKLDEISVDYETTEIKLYLAMSFGVSADNGDNWHWGPINNHLDENGKLSDSKGEPLTLEEIKNSITFITDDYWIDIKEIKEPIIVENSYTIIPIVLTLDKNDPEHNFIDKEIKYRWNAQNNDEYFSNTNNNIIDGGNLQGEDNPFYISRNITGIERGVSTRDRVLNFKLKFEYEKHLLIIE